MKDIYAYKKSLIFSICYVALATMALFSMYPDSSFHGDWTIYVMLFTLPTSVISFGLLYSGIVNKGIILMIQIIMFFLTWLITYRMMKAKK